MPENSKSFATFSEEPAADSPGGPTPSREPFADEHLALEHSWRTFGRVATAVAVFTAPMLYLALTRVFSWRPAAAVLLTALAVFAFRGLVDITTRRFVPAPSLFTDDGTFRERDVTDRRRAAFWRFWYRWLVRLGVIYALTVLVVLIVRVLQDRFDLGEILRWPWEAIAGQGATGNGLAGLAPAIVGVPILLALNVLILVGPLIYSGVMQTHVYEPGDASWGTNMDDVRGQKSAKEAIRRLVTLWQSGEAFERDGGKRERGVLFVGPPGTGKTMLAKSIATRFNAPFVTAPGPAFSQTFIGVDVLLVKWLFWRARRLARKWGGNCIVFIDEIDSLGGRREGVISETRLPSIHDVSFFGPMGALTATGDLVVESPQWRDRLFSERAAAGASRPSGLARLVERVREFTMPGGSMGQAGLQQLLTEMDGFGSPSRLRKYLTNRTNTLLDSTYLIPPRVGSQSLRLPPVRPPKADIFFIAACNVPVEALDPALTRPGRLGWSVPFRTPNRVDRRDILDLYLDRVAHTEELDDSAKRDELARITGGYSPAMIEQACSRALATAHFEHRRQATWTDFVRSLTTLGYGIDRNLEYTPDEARSLAVHEAGHAVAGRAYMKGYSSTRLSLRARGSSFGHHAMAPIEERFVEFRNNNMSDLIWTFGGMAAELVFYGETSQGVGGDLQHATRVSALMVGAAGMTAPLPDLRARFATPVEAEVAERKLMRRYQQVGAKLMNRTERGSAFGGFSLAATLEDEGKREEAAKLLGIAFMTCYWLISRNRAAVERIAETMLGRQELYGDAVDEMIDDLDITIPDIDPLDEANWPRI